MFDYHVHSTVSFDGHDSMLKCAQAARDKGFQEICFTEHHELGYPYEESKPYFDFDLYFSELKKARAAVPEIKIRAGVEAALIPGWLTRIADDLSGRGFDFVIASQHTALGQDPFFGDLFPGRTLRQAQEAYLSETLYDLKEFKGDYCVIAHLGYIDKYLDKCDLAPGDAPFQYKDFPDLLDEILLTAIRKGRGIEVNTSNYYIHGYPTPHPTIIKRFFELGGEVVTIGSDAHSADVIGHKFREARELLLSSGAKYICTFEEMKPTFVPLG
ncbi:histidinol-phosphatase HisJ family protein [Christensenella timonensis]|uniref:histidinol-phosphatase HisJ family protein n=1 Tax=Christensenella timonensis TaxID=1816678 RepID=UPI000833EFA6|nr:histidinol-phosphatase HisJ family protein [Christensenella timonensis]